LRHWRRHWHHHHFRTGPIGRYFGARLHRRIFAWFGISILLTGIVVGVLMMALGPGRGHWQRQTDGARQFISAQFAEVWEEPAKRDALAQRAARDFDVGIVLEDNGGRKLCEYGDGSCRRSFVVPVERHGSTFGSARICARPFGSDGPSFSFLLVLGAAGLTLWATSGFIARRIVRPLAELVRVTEAIGDGQFKSRARVDSRRPSEVAVLGTAINRMAERIERQMDDQRELLAGVSHEIRSPLARIRVLLELARTGGTPVKAVEKLDEIEEELIEVDRLVGELLASSRLDFAALVTHSLDAREVALRALERAGLSSDLLKCTLEDTHLEADPTLLARALGNVLDNARRHGAGVTALIVRGDSARVQFIVEDSGSGFLPEELTRVFESFVRGARGKSAAGSSLGLGLALVRRIAVAHGGDAWAENRAEGGARVGFAIPRARLASS
jgi:two-component system, OmpR family, sensor kinase